MMSSLFDHLAFQARLRPGALAVFGPAGPVSFQALVRDIDGFATELLERGLTRADMVGIQLGSSYLHVVAITALDRLSIASMSFAPDDPAPPPPVARQLGVTAIVSTRAAPAAPPCRWITVADEHQPRFGKADSARLAQFDNPPDALIRVKWSSGTTGGAKGLPQSRAVLMLRLQRRRLLRTYGPHTRYFAMTPLSAAQPHWAFAALSAGGAVVLPNPSVDFITLANTLGVTATVAPPARLAELLGGREPVYRLETMQCFDIVGAHLPGQLAREARVHLTPNLWIGYGTTETDRVSMGDAAVCIVDASAVGHITPWAACEIVDAADRPVPAAQEGFVRIRTDHADAGYYGNEAVTRRNFRNGWFYPGDVGALGADGMLRITGRVEDVIVRDGVGHSPLPIEEAIRGLAGVRDVAVFAVPTADGNEICAALVLDAGADAATIRTGAAVRLGDRAPARMFQVESLPRNLNGKVMRRTLVDWALRSAPPGSQP